MRLSRLLSDERGTTLAEMLVGLMVGTVVMAGVSTLVVVTLHTTTKVSARVDSTQRARLTLNRIVDQLHSACVAPKVAPVRKDSSGDELKFVHASGSAAVPTPTETRLKLSGTSLIQTDYPYEKGSPPTWSFSTTPSRTVVLLDHVGPISPTKPVFSYYSSSASSTKEILLGTPLSLLDASHTIHVGIAFLAHPRSGQSAEDATPARMRGGATFRLSAVSYNEAAPSLPCQ